MNYLAKGQLMVQFREKCAAGFLKKLFLKIINEYALAMNKNEPLNRKRQNFIMKISGCVKIASYRAD